AAPELDPVRLRPALMAHPIHGADIDAVGDGVAPLDRLPGGLLLLAMLRLLRRAPAAGGGVEEDPRAAHGREPRRFRVPLVPADQHTDPAELRVPRAKAEIAGGEVEFLVESRIVRDVHLAVLAEIAAVGVENGGGVVVESLRPLFEER